MPRRIQFLVVLDVQILDWLRPQSVTRTWGTPFNLQQLRHALSLNFVPRAPPLSLVSSKLRIPRHFLLHRRIRTLKFLTGNEPIRKNYGSTVRSLANLGNYAASALRDFHLSSSNIIYNTPSLTCTSLLLYCIIRFLYLDLDSKFVQCR